MSRTITPTALAELLSRESSQALFDILALSHPRLGAAPYYYVNNNQSVEFEGQVYVPAPFRTRRAPDKDGAPAHAELSISNVSLELVELLRGIQADEPRIALTLSTVGISPGQPAQRIVGPLSLVLLEFQADVATITGKMGINTDILNKAAVSYEFIAAWFPGLFPSSQ